MILYEWRPIKGFEGLYSVSSMGFVRGERTMRIRVTGLTKGYVSVSLWRNGKQFTRYMAHLVLETFVGDRPSAGHQGNHVDGNKLDNSYRNLEWATSSENHRHAIRIGLRKVSPNTAGELNGKAKLTWAKADEIRRIYAAKSATLQELADRFGVRKPSVWAVVHGLSWKVKTKA